MRTILIIDDDTYFRDYLQQVVSKQGFCVKVAKDGYEGMWKIKDEDIDLVLTDLIMPKKDCIQTIIDIKKHFPSKKVIAMSGGDSHMNAWQKFSNAKCFGADAILIKPFRKDDLLSSINQLLGSEKSEYKAVN